MAKIYTDVLLLGSGLNGLICAALLKKKGIRIIHCPMQDQSLENIPLSSIFWPSFHDSTMRLVLNQLELNLEFNRSFIANQPFSFIEEEQNCLLFHNNITNPLGDLKRSLGKPGQEIQNYFTSSNPILLEQFLQETASPEYKITLLEKIKNYCLRKKHIFNRRNIKSDSLPNSNYFHNLINFLNHNYNKNINTSLAAAIFRFGVIAPKNFSQTTPQVLAQLFRTSLHKHGAINFDHLELKQLVHNSKKVVELEMSNNDLLVARYIIDATHQGLFSGKNLNNFTEYKIKFSTTLQAISPAFPKLGIFFMPTYLSKNYFYYQITKQNLNSKYLDIFLSNHDNNNKKKLIISKFKYLAQRYFSQDSKTIPENFTEITTVKNNNFKIKSLRGETPNYTQKNSMHTSLHNLFRLDPLTAQQVGFHGDFASALSLFRMIAPKFKSTTP